VEANHRPATRPPVPYWPVIDLAAVFADPKQVAARLAGGTELYGLRSAYVGLVTPHLVVLQLELAPWAALADEGYPIERVAVFIWVDGRIAAVPHAARARTWLHRQPTPLGELCLWALNDPPGLQWQWSDGLAAYISIVHRHLQAEEYWRRTGSWPAEDAPHGSLPQSVRTPAMRAAADRWRCP
jgi:hypothetical protein